MSKKLFENVKFLQYVPVFNLNSLNLTKLSSEYLFL